ncbi:CCAAT/enhancer-binding protein zeta-like [Dendropsophus ebraccatus]|uniref:CCAAT/enhancer-binding protein zeta-like n=1 Tax=Dendropsophus ebraccatus TaxID=150705 RepID=UPI0038311E45
MNRNPLFCGADNTSVWELKKLSEHFHPSVALFAKTILEGNSVQYTGDPLQDFTLMRFLDRFVYRNPKQQKIKENNRGYLMHQKKKSYQEREPVNSATFLEKQESEIPVDEIFFHRYFKKLSTEKQKYKRKEDEESVEDVDDNEFEKILDTMEADSFYTGVNDDLDFAGNVKPADKSTKKSEIEDSDSDWGDDDAAAADDDEEISLGSMCEEDFDDESGGVFMDTSETSDAEQDVKKGKKRHLKDDDMLAAAEEFGDMLDDNTGSKFDNVGINAVSNKENASIKQLKWEAERDNWVHNKDARNIIKKKRKFTHTKINKKRQK